jgi:hypothetical protein
MYSRRQHWNQTDDIVFETEETAGDDGNAIGQTITQTEHKTPRFGTITKHKNPEAEEEDQVDIFEVEVTRQMRKQ